MRYRDGAIPGLVMERVHLFIPGWKEALRKADIRRQYYECGTCEGHFHSMKPPYEGWWDRVCPLCGVAGLVAGGDCTCK